MVFNLPINSTSLGAVSVNLLKEAHKEGDSSLIFPISQPDLSIYPHSSEFDEYLRKGIQASIYKHNRNNPILRLWHISESLFSASKKQALFTFHETSEITEYEINVLKNQDVVITSSEYSKQVFESFGVSNVVYCPLGFDNESFYRKEKEYNKNCLTFNICGKLEKRKAHKQMIRAWCHKYGNNPEYRLQLAVYNNFLNMRNEITGEMVDYNNNALSDIFGGKPAPFNVNIMPNFLNSNAAYNDFLNSADIILGMSMGEAWGLPEFQSVAIGKHAVILNAHGYKGWANNENAVMVNPNGSAEIFDNFFFKKGANVNQGNGFTFNDDDFLEGCEQAIKRSRAGAKNEAGMKLQQDFSYGKCYQKVKEVVNSL